jgi:hypothetical protein
MYRRCSCHSSFCSKSSASAAVNLDPRNEERALDELRHAGAVARSDALVGSARLMR